MHNRVNLEDKLAQFSDYRASRTVAQLNGYDVMVVKVKHHAFDIRHVGEQVSSGTAET